MKRSWNVFVKNLEGLYQDQDLEPNQIKSENAKYRIYKTVFWIRIWIHVDPYQNSSPGSGSVLVIRIRIQIQDSQNGVQKGTKIIDFKLKRALAILLKTWWGLLEPGSP